MGLLGRSIDNKTPTEKEFEKALELKKAKDVLAATPAGQGPPLTGVLDANDNKKKKPKTSGGGDPQQVINIIDDPSNPDALASFLPKGLECMDKFMPGVKFKKPKDLNEVIGLVNHAPTAAQTAVLNLQRMRTTGPGGLHSLAFAGGCLLSFGATISFLSALFGGSILRMFTSIMMGMFGATTILLEQQQDFLPKRFLMMLEEYFLFLTVMTGRGLFYLYIGALHTSMSWKTSTLNVLIGLYLIFVGYMYLKVGRNVEAKLNQLKGALHSPAAVNHAFDQFDADKSGFLDLTELSKLAAVLGSTLPSDEVFVAIDKNGDGKISRAEFVEWMARPPD